MTPPKPNFAFHTKLTARQKIELERWAYLNGMSLTEFVGMTEAMRSNQLRIREQSQVSRDSDREP